MNEKKVVIFGDSILRPIIISDDKKYTVSQAVDWDFIEKKLYVKIDNRSCMGATIKRGMLHLSNYLKADNNFQVAVIGYGGNDSDFCWEKVASDKTANHLPNTVAEEFESTLNDMIDLVTENNIKPILMTLPPISSLKYYNWLINKGLNEENLMHHLNDIEVIYRHQEYYSNLIKKIAYERGVDLVDIRQNFLSRRDYINLLCQDGIHPTAEGEQLIVQTFIERYAH